MFFKIKTVSFDWIIYVYVFNLKSTEQAIKVKKKSLNLALILPVYQELSRLNFCGREF